MHGNHEGRSDYGKKKKGTIDVPTEKGSKGILGSMPAGKDITKKAGGKGGVDSPTLDGDKGKLMGKSGKKAPYKADMGD